MTKPKIWLVVLALAVLIGIGLIYLSFDINGYDRRYQDCMNVKDSQLHSQGIYFGADRYDQAMRECEQQAGVPNYHPDHPHPLNG